MQKLKTLFTYLTIGLSLLVTTTAFAVEHIHRLAKDHALVFFFASTCKHCHQLAPTLQAIAKTYGLHIFDFSFDGKPIPGFDNPGVVTESIFKTYYVNLPAIAPVVFLQNTETLAFYPIARGGITQAALLKALSEKAEAFYAR